MDTPIETTILNAFEAKRVNRERWENEYGCLHIKKIRKEYFFDSSQYKIQLGKKNNMVYFKIVPKYFQIPCGFEYWDYYDGFIYETNIYWKRILNIPYTRYE